MKYYPAIKRNELVRHTHKSQGNYAEWGGKKPIPKVTYRTKGVIPFILHFEMITFR